MIGWKESSTTIVLCHDNTGKVTGNEIEDVFDKKDIEGRIASQIINIKNLIKLYIQSKAVIKDFEQELHHKIPLSVFRELIVNVVSHCDYHIKSQVHAF